MTITIIEFICPECGSRDIRLKVIDGHATDECGCGNCGHTDLSFNFEKRTEQEEEIDDER